MTIDVDAVTQYIREAATKRGIDPTTAVKVARSEGLGPGIWQSNYKKGGKREPSFGPFQLLVGGGDTGFPEGMGNDFKRVTGLDPQDPSTVYKQIDFALDRASENGWGAWYGAAKVGVGRWHGLKGSTARGVEADLAPISAVTRARLETPASYQPQEYPASPERPNITSAGVEAPVWNETTPRAEVADPGIWQLQKDAFNVEQTLPWLYSGWRDYLPDPNWSLSTDQLRADLEERGLPIEQYADRVASGSASQAQYADNLTAAQLDYERLTRLQQSGAVGTGLRIANQMLDPVALAADVTVGALAPQLVLARRGGRLYSTLAGAVGGAAGGAAAEGVALAVNPHRDQSDLLWATVFGFGVGGAVGSLFKSPHGGEAGLALQRAAQRAVAEYEARASPAGLSVGAAQSPATTGFLKDGAFEFVEDGDFGQGAFLGARADLSARLQASKNPVVKALSGLVQDGTGKKGGAINAISPSEETSRYFDEWSTAYHRIYRAQLDEYVKDSGSGFLKRAEAERRFNEEVFRYIRDRDVGRSGRYHPAVEKMGDRQAQIQAEILKLARNPFARERLSGRAVHGFEAIREDPHYLMRSWSDEAIIGVSRQYMEGTIDDLIAGAMRSANADLAEDLVRRTAKAFARSITNRAHGLDELAVRALGVEDMETLVETLMVHGGLPKPDAEALLSSFKKTPDAGRDARAKRRLLMDEGYRLPAVRRKDGSWDENGLSLDDLVVRDASHLFSRYARSMAGNIALARFRVKDPVTGDLLINGIARDGEFEKLKDIVRKRGADMVREGKMAKSDIDLDIKRLEFAYSSIKGRPVSTTENTDFGWWSRMIRKFNFSRIMNQVGFAQVAEVGVTVGHLGARAAFSQVPALRRMITMDGETILKSGLADDLETIIGVGTERMRAVEDYRFNDADGTVEAQRAGYRGKTEAVLNKANRLTSEVSGMTQANIMLQRWTSAAIVQKFANMAHKGGRGMSKARLADLGIDEGMHDRIMAMFLDEGNLEYTKGIVTGKKVRRLHIDRWSDGEAAEAFRNALYRYTYQLIQKNDIGNMVMWMSHPAAKMLMQFRTFMVGAYSKQTLKALHFRDAPAAISALVSMGVAGAVYVAQTKIQATGRGTGSDFEERRLSWDKIGAAAFARSGASSIVPMLVDTANYASGGDAVFSHTRTTGQVADMAFGNPSTGGLDDTAQALRGLSGLFRDGPWSQEEARALPRMLPFGNAIPLVVGYNKLIRDLPEFARRD